MKFEVRDAAALSHLRNYFFASAAVEWRSNFEDTVGASGTSVVAQNRPIPEEEGGLRQEEIPWKTFRAGATLTTSADDVGVLLGVREVMTAQRMRGAGACQSAGVRRREGGAWLAAEQSRWAPSHRPCANG